MDWASFYKDDYVRNHKMLFSFGFYLPKSQSDVKIAFTKDKQKAEKQQKRSTRQYQVQNKKIKEQNDQLVSVIRDYEKRQKYLKNQINYLRECKRKMQETKQNQGAIHNCDTSIGISTIEGSKIINMTIFEQQSVLADNINISNYKEIQPKLIFQHKQETMCKKY